MSKEVIQTSRIEQALIQNNLANLNDQERLNYYKQVCESLGLNPSTQPFGYIQLNGKLCLYAKKDATDQLRKIHSVSVIITSRTREDGIYSVTARAKTTDGREDESLGAVNILNLKGDALANALMKAETKAKRRVTLSICGLGMLDETETETIANAQPIEERKQIPAQVQQKEKDVQQSISNVKPAQETKPVVNHAPISAANILAFNFGAYKSGTSFEQIGVVKMQELRTGIMAYVLKKEASGEKVPQAVMHFIEASQQWIEQQERNEG